MPVDPARLKALDLFAGVDEDDLRRVAGWFDERHAAEGDVLTAEGVSGYVLFVIEQGAAEVVRGGERVAELGPGDLCGEIALLDGPRRSASVVATSPMRLLTLFGTDVRRLMAEVPAVADQIESVAARRLGAQL